MAQLTKQLLQTALETELTDHLGVDDSRAYVGEPKANGCAKGCISMLKEACLWTRTLRHDRRAAPGGGEFTHLCTTPPGSTGERNTSRIGG